MDTTHPATTPHTPPGTSWEDQQRRRAERIAATAAAPLIEDAPESDPATGRYAWTVRTAGPEDVRVALKRFAAGDRHVYIGGASVGRFHAVATIQGCTDCDARGLALALALRLRRYYNHSNGARRRRAREIDTLVREQREAAHA